MKKVWIKTWILILFLLPAICLGQVLNCKAIEASIGYRDVVSEKDVYTQTNEVTIPISFDNDNNKIHVMSEADKVYSTYSWEKVVANTKVTTYVIEALDNKGVYAIITLIFSEDKGYYHQMIIRYPDYILRYYFEVM